DAFQAHTISQLWLQRCEGAAGSSDAVDAALAAVAANEEDYDFFLGLNADYLDKANEIANAPKEASEVISVDEVGIEDLDASGFLGDGQCPAPHAIELGPKTFMVSLQPICDFFGNISFLLQALAYFLAVRIITR